jgi:hypothetical protein
LKNHSGTCRTNMAKVGLRQSRERVSLQLAAARVRAAQDDPNYDEATIVAELGTELADLMRQMPRDKQHQLDVLTKKSLRDVRHHDGEAVQKFSDLPMKRERADALLRHIYRRSLYYRDKDEGEFFIEDVFGDALHKLDNSHNWGIYSLWGRLRDGRCRIRFRRVHLLDSLEQVKRPIWEAFADSVFQLIGNEIDGKQLSETAFVEEVQRLYRRWGKPPLSEKFNKAVMHRRTELRAVAYPEEAIGLEEMVGIFTSMLADPTDLLNSSPRPQPTTGDEMLEDDRIITKEGQRYLPIVLAASLAQTPRQTLLDWIKAGLELGGERIETYKSDTARKLFVREDSVQRIANRFVWWPSNEPAGRIRLGQTDDKSGFVSLSEASRILRVSKRTARLWLLEGKAPSGQPEQIAKCTATDHFYIRESEVLAIKPLVPRRGLRPGRRARSPIPTPT